MGNEAMGANRVRRVVVGLALLFAMAIAPAVQAEDGTQAARAAFNAYDDGWRTSNAGEIVDAFADDFEWVNSVGLRFTDKARLKRWLGNLFKGADYAAGKPGPTVIHSVRLIGLDVAVISSTQSTFGQKDYKTGKAVPEQHSDELTVLRRTGGRWRIVSDLSSDEANGI